MNTWNEYIISKLIHYKIILEDDSEIYKFGMECLMLKLCHCMSYLCIAAYLKMLPELIIIACVLIPMRRNAGGYHAKTKTGCYIFSCCYVLIILLVYKNLLNQYIWWGALAVSDTIIFKISPVDNKSKRLDKKEIAHYRNKSMHMLILANVCCILLTAVNLYNIGNLLRCGICFAAPLLVLQKVIDTKAVNKVDNLIHGRKSIINKKM